jgi:hypothetical protein
MPLIGCPAPSSLSISHFNHLTLTSHLSSEKKITKKSPPIEQQDLPSQPTVPRTPVLCFSYVNCDFSHRCMWWPWL